MALPSQSHDHASPHDDSADKMRYVIGGDSATFKCREYLKDIGMQWDPEREAWWTPDKDTYQKGYERVQKERGYYSDNQGQLFQ